MIDWAVVGITTVGLIAILGGIYLFGKLIVKLMDLWIDFRINYLD